jgi:predicted DNA-binding transcriptional regulator AlpA
MMNMQIRFIRLGEASKILGVDRSTVYRKIKKDPNFPRLVKPLGEGTKPSAFVDSELAAYQAARIAENNLALGKNPCVKREAHAA